MLICSSSLLGGVETHILTFAKRLDKKRFNLNIVCPSEGNLTSRMRRLDIKPTIIDVRKKSNFRAIPQLIRIMKLQDIDIVQTYGLRAMFFGHLAAKLAKVKVTISDVQILLRARHKINRPKAMFFFIINKSLSIFTDTIIAASDAIKRDLVAYGHINPQKIVTIYNAIDLYDFKTSQSSNRIKEELKIGLDSHVVGIVARLVPEKAIDVFIKAALKVVNKIPQTTFLIVGDGPLRGILEGLVSKQGLCPNFIFTGFRTDVPNLISVFDVGVLSSIFEGFGYVILEYMAQGKPVVATGVGGIPEIVEDKETGLLVPAGNPELLAEAIISLLQDKDKAREMGLAGRAMVESKFSAEKMVEEFERLYLLFAREKKLFD